MTRQFSKLIAWGCIALFVAAPVIALYYLINIELFASAAKSNLALPIQWHTVSTTQWYSLWLVTLTYVALGLAGLYFLRRAFANFAQGELFNFSNSRDLRMFSVLLFAQAVAKPLHFTLASIVLSMNHPAGQKILSLSFGSGEIKMLAIAMMLWVMSDLLVDASKLQNENNQFI